MRHARPIHSQERAAEGSAHSACNAARSRRIKCVRPRGARSEASQTDTAPAPEPDLCSRTSGSSPPRPGAAPPRLPQTPPAGRAVARRAVEWAPGHGCATYGQEGEFGAGWGVRTWTGRVLCDDRGRRRPLRYRPCSEVRYGLVNAEERGQIRCTWGRAPRAPAVAANALTALARARGCSTPRRKHKSQPPSARADSSADRGLCSPWRVATADVDARALRETHTCPRAAVRELSGRAVRCGVRASPPSVGPPPRPAPRAAAPPRRSELNCTSIHRTCPGQEWTHKCEIRARRRRDGRHRIVIRPHRDHSVDQKCPHTAMCAMTGADAQHDEGNICSDSVHMGSGTILMRLIGGEYEL